MSLADYLILAVVVLAAVGAIVYGRRHPSGCSKGCASCGQDCPRKKSDPSGAATEEKSGAVGSED